MERLDTLAATLSAVAAAIAAVTPTEEVRLLAFCTIGAVAGGFVGAAIATQTTTDRRNVTAKRWAVNCAAGLFLGPVLTEYLIGEFPDFSRLYIAIFSGGACGVAAVALLCVLWPLLLSRLKSKVSKLP